MRLVIRSLFFFRNFCRKYFLSLKKHTPTNFDWYGLVAIGASRHLSFTSPSEEHLQITRKSKTLFDVHASKCLCKSELNESLTLPMY